MADEGQVVNAGPMDDWELSKENYQPLKAGRKPGALQVLSTIAQNSTAEEQRKAYWTEIDEYKGDDPLEVWLRFIKWTQETFKTGGHKAEVLPLLERCTRELQSIERYKTDIRYLRVWIQYADCLPDPGDVFTFLKENDIGLDHALYYIAYATYLELRANYAGADNIYQQGINRQAAPVERLKAKFDEFQHRMVRRMQRKAQEEAEGCDEPGHPERHTLGLLGGGRRNNRSAGLGGSKRKAVATPGRDNNTSGNGGLQIFVDDEFSNPASSAPAAFGAAASSVSLGPSSAWSQLPTFEQTRKENVMQAGIWVGQRIRQKQTQSAPAAPPLDIPIDPEFSAAAPAQLPLEPSYISLRQRLDKDPGSSHLDEKLVHDPLSLHRGVGAAPPPPMGGVPPSQSSLMSGLGGGLSSTTTSGLRPKREEVLAVNLESLQGADGTELSFEELRGRQWLEAQAVKQAAAPTQQNPAASSSAALNFHGLDQPQKASPFEPEACAPPVSQAADQALNAIQSTVEGMDRAEMTMSTKEAFAAINAAFSSRSFGGSDHRREFGSSSSMYEPTMTINTKDAFAAINMMFGGSVNPTSVADSLGPEPTVSFKAAFDVVNQMFGSGKVSVTNNVHPATEGSASQPLPGASEPLYIRTDTGLGSSAQLTSPPAVDSPGLVIREDTLFINPSMRGNGAEDVLFDIREDTVFINHQQPMAAGDNCGSSGFDIREDTIFINRPASGASNKDDGDGFDIREDTIFINHPAITAVPAHSTLDDGGFDIREDTLYINRSAPTAAAAASVKTPGTATAAIENSPHYSILPDTEPASKRTRDDDDTVDLRADSSHIETRSNAQHAQQVGKWGFAPGADDTMDLGFAASQAAVAPQPRQTLTEQLHDLNIIDQGPDDKENAMSENHAAGSVASRHLKDCGGSVLQPLDPTLGLEIEDNIEAEESLRAVTYQEGQEMVLQEDEFQVYCDDGPSQPSATPPVAASTNKAGTEALTVDPFSIAFKQRMLSFLDPPVSQWSGVSQLTSGDEQLAATTFKRGKKTAAPLGAAATTSLARIDFLVGKCIGSGAYATVYQASVVNPDAASDAMVNGICSSDVALKYESPACPWEWYICRALQGRLPAEHRGAFLDPTGLLLGSEASVLVMPRGRSGTLQDFLNIYLKQGQRPDECLVMHCALKLLRTLQLLQEARILHTDIKPDNFLVVMSNTALDLQLIDFGRSVDLELLPSGCLMKGDCGTDGFRCVEMKENCPWLWQADAYGIAGVIHCLLFGDYMDVERVVSAEGETSLRIKAPLRRYWDTELWNDVFDLLLNGARGQNPVQLLPQIAKLEEKLAGTSDKLQQLCAKLAGVVRADA